MHLFTVFTPTYNRSTLLARTYASLKRQTFKDFIWLIIDDGSTDETSVLVDAWKNEGIVDIEYHYKKNEGKHTAFKMAVDLIQTPYMLDIDDDDELTDDCLQVFHDEWIKLEREGNTEIGSIRALVMDEQGKILGNYDSNNKILDVVYNDYIFKEHKGCENITSNRTNIMKSANLFRDENRWMYDKIRNINPGIFWMRLGEHTKTRYLFRPLRVYHYDAPYSLTRIKKNYRQMWINRFFTTRLELEEFKKYAFFSPRYFMHIFMECSVYSIAVGLPIKKVYNSFKSHLIANLFLVTYPLAWIGSLYLKRKRRGLID